MNADQSNRICVHLRSSAVPQSSSDLYLSPRAARLRSRMRNDRRLPPENRDFVRAARCAFERQNAQFDTYGAGEMEPPMDWGRYSRDMLNYYARRVDPAVEKS